MEKTLQEQAKIVKERLHYHFGKVDGKWFLPNNKMPFMYEFLSEVDRLCALADSSHESSGLNKPIVPRFLKTKYTLEELDQYIRKLSARTDKHIHRGKIDDIKKLIRWRRRYDSLNEAK